MKKSFLYIITIISTVFFSACEKFLELDPLSEIGSTGFYQNEDEVNAGIIAIYDGLQEIPNLEYALTEMRSDNAKTRNSEGEWAQFEKMNVNPANGTLSSYWSAAYNVVFRANTVLPHLDIVEDANTKAQFEGEILFARALIHFNLVQLFGDIPIINKVIGPEETGYFVRKPVSEVYDFIVEDLTNAVAMLPTRANIAEGRATKGAAQALLAKVYLTLHNYSSALPLLNAVITSPDYSLLPDYHDVFFTPRNKEIIFGMQYIEGDALNGQDFSYAFSSKGRAGGLNWPTDNLFAAMDTTVDARTSTTFFWEAAAGSSGDWACGKYVNPNNVEFAGNPWIFLRLADVYLMYCEAVLAGGTSTTDATSLSYINAIRSRAALSPLTEITQQSLLDERRIELALENHRFFDLVRFGVAETVLGAYSLTPEGGFVFDPNDLLLPIPQRELNIYPAMGQNPGY